MTVYSQFYYSGQLIEDAYSYDVNKSISENNSSSDFSAYVENIAGRNATTFQVGPEVCIYADTNWIQPSGEPFGQFRFNEGTGSDFFDSIQNNQGSLIGDFTSWTQGKIGSALNFIGSQGFAVLSTGSPNVFTRGSGDSFTYTFWVKPTGSAGANFGRIMEDTYVGWYPGQVRIQSEGGSMFNVSLARFDGTNNPTAVTGYISRINEWSHIACVYNNDLGSLYIYQNGYLRNATKDTTVKADQTGSQGFTYFGNTTVGTRGFTGQLDDFRIYRRPLTDYEILAICNALSGTEMINNGSQLLFKGIVENISYEGVELDEKITLTGRDFSARLVDRTVEPEVYTNMEIGSIVRDIIRKYTSNITTSGVMTVPGSPLARIVFNHTPVYDAVNQLAQLADYNFYVDVNKDLSFAPAGSVSSGYTFDSGNSLEDVFQVDRESLFNQVWVYGDRYLDGFQETLTAGSPLGGSIFTLLYNPHNTQVRVSGAIIQPGGIDELTNTPVSGAKYLVNFLDKQIIFTSGTDIGANIPTSGNQVIIDYQRTLPVVKVGNNDPSISQFSQRNKIIVDKNIKDPLTAAAILKEQLATLANPKIEGNLDVYGIVDVVPGQTAIVNFPNQNINSQTYEIIEAKYAFNTENNLSNRVLSLKLNKRIGDVTDTLKDTILELRRINAQDITTSDVITRFQFATGSYGYQTSGVLVYTRTGLGSSFILGIPNTNPGGVGWGGVLGSSTASGVNYLGDSRNALVLVWSGGYPT